MNTPDWVAHLTPRLDAFLGFFDEPTAEPPEVDSDGRAIIDIRGAIGYHADADVLAPIIRGLDATTLEVHIDSPGGNVWHGVALGNALRQHPAKVNVHVDAVAASAASVIAMAGDTITMHPGAVMMVHNARGFADSATADDLRALAELMDKINLSMADIYAARAGGDRAGWLEVMAAETWFSGPEAIEAGLADASVEVTGREIEDDSVDAGVDLAQVFGWRYDGREQAPAPNLESLTLNPDPDPDKIRLKAEWAEFFQTIIPPEHQARAFAAAMTNHYREGT